MQGQLCFSITMRNWSERSACPQPVNAAAAGKRPCPTLELPPITQKGTHPGKSCGNEAQGKNRAMLIPLCWCCLYYTVDIRCIPLRVDKALVDADLNPGAGLLDRYDAVPDFRGLRLVGRLATNALLGQSFPRGRCTQRTAKAQKGAHLSAGGPGTLTAKSGAR